MKVVNLTCPPRVQDKNYDAVLRKVDIKSGSTQYTGMVWNIAINSMAGSYIDFPGHILETDDGTNGDNANAGFYYRHRATVIHLDRTEGAVTAQDLQEAVGEHPVYDFLIVNAIGERNPHDVAWRGIYFDMTAVDWIIRSGCRLLVSDIYESRRLEGVFLKLFAAGVTCVCEPINLWMIPSEVFLTVSFPRWNITQIPCTLLAEFE